MLVTLLSFFGPILGAAAVAYYGYKRAVKLASVRQPIENRKLDLAEYQAIVTDLRAEIDRTMKARVNAELACEEEIEELRGRNLVLDDNVEHLRDLVYELSAWVRAVIQLLGHPDIKVAMEARQLEIPPLPPLDDWWKRGAR